MNSTQLMAESRGLVDGISASINVPVDLIKTMLLMLSSLLLAPCFRILDRPVLRYAYSLVLGIGYVYYLQQEWVLYVLAVALVPYALIIIAPSKSFQISCATSFCFLLFIHSYRFVFDHESWKIDCSVTVMYLVTKVIYYGHHVATTKKTASLFSYLSYCFFFPSVMIGPTFSFQLFEEFIHSPATAMPKSALYGNLFMAVILAVLTGLLLPIFDSYWIVSNERFVSLPAVVQYLSLNVIGLIYRLKFYMAWGFTQIAINISGLSWNTETGRYDRVTCGSFRFQTEINPKVKTPYWNTSIQVWLKEVIYDRMLEKTRSTSMATYATFIISAFWHGIHLTYYVGFIEWAIIVQISKWAYKVTVAVPQLAESAAMRVLAYVISQSMINYTGMFIVVLTWKQATQAYANMWYLGNVMMGVFLLASLTINPKIFKAKPLRE